MGINKTGPPSCENSMADPIHSNPSATNNNSKNSDGNNQATENEPSIGFSSLMDIGQAYGIWNPDVDGANFKKKSQSSSAADDDKEKLVIDDDQDIDDDEDDDEPLSPGIYPLHSTDIT